MAGMSYLVLNMGSPVRNVISAQIDSYVDPRSRNTRLAQRTAWAAARDERIAYESVEKVKQSESHNGYVLSLNSTSFQYKANRYDESSCRLSILGLWFLVLQCAWLARNSENC